MMIILLLFILVVPASLALTETTFRYPVSPKGAYWEWGGVGCDGNINPWVCVEEQGSPDTSDYLVANYVDKSETLNFEDLVSEYDADIAVDSINSITLNYYASQYSSSRYRFRVFLMDSPQTQNLYYGTTFSTSGTWGYKSQVFFVNPWTGLPWTRQDFKDLQAGMTTDGLASAGGKVAQMYAAINYDYDHALRPNGDVLNAWSNYGCADTSEYKCVRELQTPYTQNYTSGGGNKEEAFTLTDLPANLNSTPINSITLQYYAQRLGTFQDQFKPSLRIGGNLYYGDVFTVGSSWAYYSDTFTTNPATGNAWTFSEINSLEAGMSTEDGIWGLGGAKVAQFYVTVNHG